MNPEHKRPLYAFAGVAALCALLLGLTWVAGAPHEIFKTPRPIAGPAGPVAEVPVDQPATVVPEQAEAPSIPEILDLSVTSAVATTHAVSAPAAQDSTGSAPSGKSRDNAGRSDTRDGADSRGNGSQSKPETKPETKPAQSTQTTQATDPGTQTTDPGTQTTDPGTQTTQPPQSQPTKSRGRTGKGQDKAQLPGKARDNSDKASGRDKGSKSRDAGGTVEASRGDAAVTTASEPGRDARPGKGRGGRAGRGADKPAQSHADAHAHGNGNGNGKGKTR